MENEGQYENKKNTKSRKAVKIIFNVLFYLVMVVFIAVLIFSFVQKIAGNDSYLFFGLKGMIVQTGSMSFKYDAEFLEGHDNQLKVDDLVFTRRIEEDEEIEIYDIVTFKLGDATVIHRVVDIQIDSVTGQKLYITRGDATPENDSAKTREQLTGIYVFSLGQFGVAIKFLQSVYGIIALIACIAILAIASLIIRYMKNEQPKNDKDTPRNDSEFSADSLEPSENDNEESLEPSEDDNEDSLESFENVAQNDFKE